MHSIATHTNEVVSLAIVGSRDMGDRELFEEGITCAIEMLGKLPDCVVSGGARGADTLGAEWATANGIPLKVFRPNWKMFGKAAGVMRNTDIINAATHVLAFPSKHGRGTQDSIRKAQKSGKPCIVLFIERE